MEDKKIVNVHSAAIHIENKVSLVSRKAWFYFMYRALPNMMLQEEFIIPLMDLTEAIGYTSTNIKYLKESIKELTTTTIEFNIFNKSRSSWEINVLLAGCKIENGLCTFSFSPMLKRRLVNPEMYIKLDLYLSRKFKSKHTLALYSLALDYLFIKENYGEKNFTVDELKKFLGFNDKEYTRIVDLNRDIIKKAVKEINENTDMEISIEAIKGYKQKITGFKMQMKIKTEHLDNYNSIKNKSQIMTKQIEQEKPKEIIREVIETTLKRDDLKSVEFIETTKVLPNKISNLDNKIIQSERIKIKDEILNKFFSQYRISVSTNTVQEKLKDIKNRFGDTFEEYLIFLVKYTNQELKRQSINNISGFYVGLLKDDSQLDNYIVENEQKEIDKKNNNLKIKNLVNKEIKNEYDKYLSSDFHNYLLDNLDELEDKISNIIKSTVSSGSYLYDMILAKNNFVFTKELLTEPKSQTKAFIINHLDNYKDNFDYEPLTFEEWKNQEITEEYVKDLKLNLLDSN